MKKIIHKLFTLVDIILTWPIFLLSTLTPRKKERWAFIGWHRGKGTEIFADNCKYLFIHTHHHEKSIEPIWIAKDNNLATTLTKKGYRSYSEKSWRGIWATLTAGVIVIDAYLLRENFRYTGRAKIVQLLHGKGMKTDGYTKAQPKDCDYLFSPSPFVLSMLPNALTRSAKKFITGYSRNDLFYRDIPDSDISSDKEAVNRARENRSRGLRNVLYAPTFRRGLSEFDLETILDLETLVTKLNEEGMKLFVSLHPKYRNIFRKKLHDQVCFVLESDIYPFLKEVDLLITDYSSSYTDYLLLDRPVLFYPFDLKEYSEKEGININYDEYTPGEKVYKAQDLPGKIIYHLEHPEATKDHREKVRRSYHAYQDGKSSERIMAILHQELIF